MVHSKLFQRKLSALAPQYAETFGLRLNDLHVKIKNTDEYKIKLNEQASKYATKTIKSLIDDLKLFTDNPSIIEILNNEMCKIIMEK